jgi:hypothetical protein
MADTSGMTGTDYRAFGRAAGAGGLGAGLAGMLFSQDNPYEKASPYFNQIPQVAQQQFNPYIQAGQGALGNLQGQYGQLTNDPGARLNQIGGSFHQSPGYQWQLQQALGASNNASAAGGMLGTPQHQQQNMQVAEGLANQDYYNYLGNALGLYGQGLQGEQGINAMGYGATGQLSNALTGNLANQGAMAYANASDKNAQQQSMWGDVFGGLAGLAFL